MSIDVELRKQSSFGSDQKSQTLMFKHKVHLFWLRI